jgi:hypothetical protein
MRLDCMSWMIMIMNIDFIMTRQEARVVEIARVQKKMLE